ncbi:GNAT family N-acetyltransferase [Natronolimnobius baerhuensis]|uniref:GNAT family N-acetyltransferase n=1 Tax=Natronolimnobius baerhuensis TaxID=253108 RepID=A0A202E953_9EURY|nr:GNAT family N-acetyltransferase [Natronolimnobius baerhuensis]OVE84772.1 GNAT family N-acetyltransferase [Natronolimnobius baerhuensis]
MEYDVLGWPPDGPKLRLDYRRFSYAGKFVMTNTGKAVAREKAAASDSEHDQHTGEAYADDVVAAVAFNEDRTDDNTLWLRYVTVARDRRGDGIGPKLCGLVRDRAIERGYDRLKIAVNNPFAYEALYRTGFTYTGETTGIAELVLAYPPETLEGGENDPQERYQAGLEEFRERELSAEEVDFLESRQNAHPPKPISSAYDDPPSERRNSN